MKNKEESNNNEILDCTKEIEEFIKEVLPNEKQ